MNSRLYVATPSRWLMDKVQASMMQSAVVDSRVIPNGVDLSVFCPGDKQFARHALGLSQSAHVALFVGYGAHNNPWKDYATMESAIMRLATRIDEREIVFVCLGGQGADKRVGSASIRFVNAERDPHNVAQFYRAADIYLHAARADTFPTVILEALACGTPVVATAVGGIPEQIEQGNTGFVVPPGDATAMADCTEKLLGDKPRQQYMSAQAATLARHRFDLKRMVEEYIDWYQEILQGEGSRA